MAKQVTWHFIEGEAGCEFAVAQKAVAVVVDSLRASATATMLLDAGAREILAVRSVEDARAAKLQDPEALVFGERGGLPPEGFDFGNSPRDAHHAEGRRVIFTTTTGAGRLVSCTGAHAVCMGTTVNAAAAAQYAAAHGVDVVVIPAGLTDEPDFDAQEDRVAAAAIMMEAEATGTIALGEGAEEYRHWRARILDEGVDALFASAPHAEKLRRVKLDADIAYCAQLNLTRAVPVGVALHPLGVVLKTS